VSKIKIIPENLANQIAAGEVIERPASVVKEFIENAIDAGAHNISIQIEGDGSRLIRVVDDGAGMEQDDVLLSLERHATSKLESAEQLSSIQTLGFRGEAIPSIASVSKLTITSRPHDDALGSQAEIRFGKLFKVHDMGCPPGTVMEVKDLFGNVPVRKKFLKSRQTEISHIDEIIKNYALVQNELGFHWEVQGKTMLDVPAHGESLEKRVRRILCREESETLVDFCFSDRESDITVSGYLSAPENSTSGAGGVRIFVNGRAVKDRVVGHAVSEGLRNFLLKGRRAKGVLFVHLPSQDVDVNVHPTKQEIRFRRPQKVHNAVLEALREAMERYQKKVRYEIFGAPKSTQEVEFSGNTESPRTAPKTARMGHNTSSENEFLPAACRFEVGTENAASVASEPMPDYLPVSPVDDEPSAQRKEGQGAGRKIWTVEPQKNALPPQRPAHAPAEEDRECLPVIGTMRYVGQLFNAYILCETESGFILVDQHAAQERLIFEELLKQYRDSRIPCQVLLFPEIIDVSPADRQNLEQNEEEINRIGLEIKDFGGNSFIVQGVPASLSHLSPGEIVKDVLARFSADEKGGGTARLEHVLAGMACKASVKAGRKLLPEEVEALLTQMRQAGIFSHCPHGRPVVKSFSKDDVKKWFLRT
jgi:DNA mismatch repair protein MutL